MQLIYCDETNLEERSGDFLIYGGLIVEASVASELSKSMDALRNQLRVPRDYHLKFNPGPDNFTHEQFVQLKESVLRLAG